MNVTFEHNYQKKVMQMSFPEPTSLATGKDVLAWRTQWTNALKTWHSPYKALVDCRNLTVAANDEVKTELARMEKFLKGFFLKNAVGFGFAAEKNHDLLFFEVLPTEEDGNEAVGLGRVRAPVDPKDFRGTIQLSNHFQQHVMELTFAAPVTINTPEQIDVIKSKIMNNLMQWHSRWSLLIDCSNVEFSGDLKESFAKFERYLGGFFLKKVIGYSPKGPKDSYPFEVFRARHNAAARLESEGNFSGEDADCRSRKTPV